MYLTLTTLLYFSSSVSTGSYSQELVVSRVPSRICQVASSGEDKNKRAFYRASYLEVGPGENKLSSIRNDRVILRNMPSLLYVILRAAIGFKYSTLFARGVIDGHGRIDGHGSDNRAYVVGADSTSTPTQFIYMRAKKQCQ